MSCKIISSFTKQRKFQLPLLFKLLSLKINFTFSPAKEIEVNEYFTQSEKDQKYIHIDQDMLLHKKFNSNFLNKADQKIKRIYKDRSLLSANSSIDEIDQKLNYRIGDNKFFQNEFKNQGFKKEKLLDEQNKEIWNKMPPNQKEADEMRLINSVATANEINNISLQQKQKTEKIFSKEELISQNQEDNIENWVKETLEKIEQASSGIQKLEVAQKCFLFRKKAQKGELTKQQKDDLYSALKEQIESVSNAPYRYGTNTIFAVLNIARQDCLNIKIDSKLLDVVRYICDENFNLLSLREIKQVFFASCLRHSETMPRYQDQTVSRQWLQKIFYQVDASEIDLKELIIFLTYYNKDFNLFKSSCRFIEHLFLQPPIYGENLPLILRAQNPELLRVLANLFTKHERGSQQFYGILLASFYDLIEKQIIDISYFHQIIRYLLKSSTFQSYGLLPKTGSFSNDRRNLVSQSSFKQEFEEDSTYITDISENSSALAVVDKFVNYNMNKLYFNEILNLINFYYQVGDIQYKSTVESLLKQLFSEQNDEIVNLFAFSLVFKSIALYQISNPSYYFSFFKEKMNYLFSENRKESQSALIIMTLKYLVKECELPQFIENEFNSQVSFLSTPKTQKKQYPVSKRDILFSKVEKLIHQSNMKCSPHYYFGALELDYKIYQNQLNLQEFALEILPSQEHCLESMRCGDLQIKAKILREAKIPCVFLGSDFFNSIEKQDESVQIKQFVAEIQKQLH